MSATAYAISPTVNDVVTAQKIKAAQRLRALPKYFGMQHMMKAESAIFDALESMSVDYNGGYWEFYELSNGGFYMAPVSPKEFKVVCGGNYFSGTLSADAAGIVASLFAINGLVWTTQEGRFSDLYHALRDFASHHPEAGLILSAIN